MSTPKLELRTLRKEYEGGDVVAVDNIDLSIAAGETVALLGSSGCGKSTTLNMIVGLENPTSGEILIDGQSIVNVPAGKRNVGLVFQDYAVFTSMSVRKNLAFGLEVRGVPKAEIDKAVDEVAELLCMTDRLNAKPKELGGSELQRVAIGRTLVTRPQILLLDEPLSNLESAARLAMRKELRRLQSDIGLTIIYVTHDQIEALSLADRIAVMNAGKILQVEKTSIICERPGHSFVAGFLGSPPMNLMWGQFRADQNGVAFAKNRFALPLTVDSGEVIDPKTYFILGVRPESLRQAPVESAALTGTVRVVEPLGPEAIVTVEVNKELLKFMAPSGTDLAEGREVGLDIDYDAVCFFSGETNRRLDLRVSGRQN